MKLKTLHTCFLKSNLDENYISPWKKAESLLLGNWKEIKGIKRNPSIYNEKLNAKFSKLTLVGGK